jgi:hypothetical protein
VSLQVVVFKPFHIELLSAQGVQAGQVSQEPASFARVSRPPGPALTLFDDDQVLVCGGICTMSPRLGLLWALLSANAGRHMLWIHRATLRFIDTEPLQRLEASVEKGFGAGCRWVQLLGFEYEGDMRGYGEGGETHERWARVRL